MNYIKFKSENGTIIGSLINGSVDLGDYGVCTLIDIKMPNGETRFSVPENKIERISKEEYNELRELIYGF